MLAAIAVAGCGRVHFDPHAGAPSDGPVDVATDASEACANGFGPFGSPEALVEFQGGTQEFDPSLRGDRLELVFASSGQGLDIFSATRPSTTAAFSTPVLMSSVSSPQEDFDPSITADGLTLYVGSDRASPGNSHLFVATRTSTSDAFSTPSAVTGLESVDVVNGFDLTLDGLTVFLDVAGDIGSMSRVTTSAPFGSTVALGLAGAFPSISSDGLELYVESNSMLGRYTRTSTADAFGPFEAFAISITNIHDPDISADGTELTFQSEDTSSLYRMVRTCL